MRDPQDPGRGGGDHGRQGRRPARGVRQVLPGTLLPDARGGARRASRRGTAWSRCTAAARSPTTSTWPTRSTPGPQPVDDYIDARPGRSAAALLGAAEVVGRPSRAGCAIRSAAAALAARGAAGGGVVRRARCCSGRGQLPAVPLAPYGRRSPTRAASPDYPAGHAGRAGGLRRRERARCRRRGQGARPAASPANPVFLPAPARGGARAGDRLPHAAAPARRALAAPEPVAQHAGDLLGLPALVAVRRAAGDPVRRASRRWRG